MSWSDALRALHDVPSIRLASGPSPVEELPRLRDALGGGPRLLVKRDDALSFGFGGNKVRKLELVAAQALAEGADTLVTCGGIQSNHARATAATAAKLGLKCRLIANGSPLARPTANALLDALLGAEVEYVATREERAPAMRAAVESLRAAGHRPFEIPLGASTPLGALGFVGAVTELVSQLGVAAGPPDVIIHATSSGGTQAGLVAGCVLHGLPTRVVGVSADDSAAALSARVLELVRGIGERLGVVVGALATGVQVEVDDAFVGAGYGIPTPASQEAIELAARTEALFLDPTYTAKAMAGLISYLRDGRLARARSVLFWHTGGQVGLFA